MRRPTARASSIVAVTSTASSSSSFRSNGQRAASPVSVSAPALLTQMSSPSQTPTPVPPAAGTPRGRAGRPAATAARPPARRTRVGGRPPPPPRSAGRGRSRRRRPPPVPGRSARPMPLVEPVTRARRPANSRPGDGPAGRTPSRSASRSAMVRCSTGWISARRDLGQRLQHEQPLVQSRMRQRQLRIVADRVAVQEQIEVDGARAVAFRRAPGPGRFPRPAATRSSVVGGQVGAQLGDGVEVRPLSGRAADGGRLVHGGDAHYLDARPAAQLGQRRSR